MTVGKHLVQLHSFAGTSLARGLVQQIFLVHRHKPPPPPVSSVLINYIDRSLREYDFWTHSTNMSVSETKHTTLVHVLQYPNSFVEWKQIQYAIAPGDLAAASAGLVQAKPPAGQSAICLLSEVRHRPVTDEMLSFWCHDVIFMLQASAWKPPTLKD